MPEVTGVFQRLEDRAIQPLTKINRLLSFGALQNLPTRALEK